MRNNITRQDLDRVIEFLKQENPILTQSSNVQAFEEEKTVTIPEREKPNFYN